MERVTGLGLLIGFCCPFRFMSKSAVNEGDSVELWNLMADRGIQRDVGGLRWEVARFCLPVVVFILCCENVTLLVLYK